MTDTPSSAPVTQDEQLRAAYAALTEDQRVQLAALAAAVVGRVDLREVRTALGSSAPFETAVQLADTLWPPQPPPEADPVSEFYRVSWTEDTVEHQQVHLTAAELARLTRDGSGLAGIPVRTTSPASFALLLDDPAGYNLLNSLADLDLNGRGSIAEFERYDLDIRPLSREELLHSGQQPRDPLICQVCGARVTWQTIDGYQHAESAEPPRDGHTAGDPVEDRHVFSAVQEPEARNAG